MKTLHRHPAEAQSARLEHRPNNRRGSGLVKCIVIMTMFSMLMTIAGTALFRMFRQQMDLSTSIAHSSVLSRLARDFRSDVHAAKEAKIVGDAGREIVFRSGDDIITWSAGPDGLTRTARKEQATDAGIPEKTRLLDVEFRFEVLPSSAGGLSRARMMLNPTAEARFHVLAPMSVDAAIGSAHRFEKALEAS